MATKQYTYQIRKIASTPRNKRLTDGIQQAAQSGGGGIGYIPSSTPQYWQLVTTDTDGNPLEEAQYYLQPVQGQHLLMPGDVVAYAVDPDIEDVEFPIASYTQKGILSVASGTGLVIEDGVLSINPDLIGGGGIDTEQLASYLTQNNYVNQQWLVDNGYLKLTSPLTGYVKPGAYSPITAEDTLIGAIGKLEANFGNYVDLTTDQTIGGNKTFNNLIVGKDDVVCYAVGDVEDVAFPLASYTQKGILSVQQGTGLLVSNGVLSLDPDYAGGGGVNFTPGTALELTSGGTLNVKIGTTSGTVCAGNDTRLTTAYNNSHTHSNKSVLDGITSGYVSNWNTAYNLSHSHSNKSVLDGISSSDVSNWGTAYNNAHWHSNKSYLDVINQNLSTSSAPRFLDLTIGSTSNVQTVLGAGSGNCINGITSSGGAGNLYLNYFGSSSYTKIDADNNLLTTGDIVAYSTTGTVSDISAVATTSTYGLIKYDGSTIGKNSSGQLYVINGGGGGGSSSVAWSNITGKPSWIGSSKPSYSWSEITSKPSWIGSSKPSYSWSEISSKPTIISSIGYSNTGSSGSGKVVTKVTASGSTVYVTYGTDQTGSGGSWNGGTVSTNIVIQRSAATLEFRYSTSNFWRIYQNNGSGYYLQWQCDTGYPMSLQKSGLLQIKGSLSQNSDLRIKNITGYLVNALDDLMKIPIIRYVRTDLANAKEEIGFGAQHLLPYYPEMVIEGMDGLYSVNYSAMSAVAIAGLKELYSRFRPVENKVKVLESKVRNLQARLDNAYREIFNLKEGKETA